jgi:hypothetical protein
MKRTIMRSSAERVTALASYLLPAAHRAWAQDMRAELDHVESDAAALSWSIGCLMASLYQRVNAMLKLNAEVSRSVLMLEWLMCFGPLTLLWVAAVRYIAIYKDASTDILIATATGTLGPLALVAAFAATLTKTHARYARLATILATAFGAMMLLRLVDMGGQGRLNLAWFKFDWSLIVLISLLPMLGCLHLVYLSRPRA